MRRRSNVYLASLTDESALYESESLRGRVVTSAMGRRPPSDFQFLAGQSADLPKWRWTYRFFQGLLLQLYISRAYFELEKLQVGGVFKRPLLQDLTWFTVQGVTDGIKHSGRNVFAILIACRIGIFKPTNVNFNFFGEVL